MILESVRAVDQSGNIREFFNVQVADLTAYATDLQYSGLALIDYRVRGGTTTTPPIGFPVEPPLLPPVPALPAPVQEEGIPLMYLVGGLLALWWMFKK